MCRSSGLTGQRRRHASGEQEGTRAGRAPLVLLPGGRCTLELAGYCGSHHRAHGVPPVQRHLGFRSAALFLFPLVVVLCVRHPADRRAVGTARVHARRGVLLGRHGALHLLQHVHGHDDEVKVAHRWLTSAMQPLIGQLMPRPPDF